MQVPDTFNARRTELPAAREWIFPTGGSDEPDVAV